MVGHDGSTGAPGTDSDPHTWPRHGSTRRRQGGLHRGSAAAHLSADEGGRNDQLAFFYKNDLAYALEMATRPDAVRDRGFPIGLAA